MHLLIAVPAYAPFVGGAQTLCRALAQRLVANGQQVTILTTNGQQADDFWLPPPAAHTPLPPRAELDGAQIVRLSLAYPWPAPYRFGLIRRASHSFSRLPLPFSWQQSLLRHFTRFMPPLLALQSEAPPLVAAADLVLAVDASWEGLFVGVAQAAFSQGKPLIVIPLIHTGGPAITAHFRMAHQVAIYQQAAATIALSPPEEALLADWGVERDRLHCLPLGVEPLGVESRAAENLDTDAEGVELPARYILFLGAATYDKGAFALALAVVELAQRGEEVAIVYAGPQQHRLAVFIDTQPAAVRAILKERTRLLGVVDEVTKQALLARCVALALPSRVDSFGIVLLEAWLHSKPVVAAAVGGPASIVADEETGLLVPFDAPEALATAAQRLLNEPGLAARLGANGRQVVINQYTGDTCYDTFYQIASDTLGAADNTSTGTSTGTPAGTPTGRSNERL